jgi:hypothetical protein
MAISPSQYAAKLKRLARDLESGEIMLLAGGSAIGRMAERVFVRGEDVSGGTKNYNTTDELWVSDFAAPKGQSNTGKTGKNIKTTYYSSYSAFRSAMGREASVMNFRLNNELQSDLLNSPVNKSSNAIGQPKLKTVAPNEFVISLKNSANTKKADGLEARFGVKIFQLSPSEIDFLKSIYQQEINKRLQ